MHNFKQQLIYLLSKLVSNHVMHLHGDISTIVD